VVKLIAKIAIYSDVRGTAVKPSGMVVITSVRRPIRALAWELIADFSFAPFLASAWFSPSGLTAVSGFSGVFGAAARYLIVMRSY
jgi:hypothetical protein